LVTQEYNCSHDKFKAEPPVSAYKEDIVSLSH